MKRIAAQALIGWLLLAGSIWASQVTNVTLSYQDGGTVARIDIQGPVRYTHQTEVPKDGRPDRVIVDVLSATHELGAREFSNLPRCVVTGIRSSQYAVSPEKIVRIVFDLKATPVYQVDSDDHSITIKFNNREEQSFAAWSSSSRSNDAPAKTAAVVAEAPRPSAPTPVNAAAKNEVIEKDRLASLAPEKSAPAKSQPAEAKPAKPEAVKPTAVKPEAAPAAVDPSGMAFAEGWSTPQSWKPTSVPPLPSAVEKPKPVTVAQAPAVETPKATEKTAPKPAVEKPQAAPQIEKSQPAPVAEKSRELAVKPEPVKTESPASAGTAAFPSANESLTYSPLQAPLPAPAETKAPVVATTETAPKATPTATPSAPVEKPKAMDDQAAPKVADGSAEKENLLDEADFAPAVELPATVKPEDLSKVVVTDAAKAQEQEEKTPQRATSRFRREAQSDKIRGTMVAEFPERLVIQYKSEGRRDPFDALIDDTKSFNNPVENRIPNVEGLKLVGILESETGNNRALFEDKGGFSYILQSGDKVRNGYVLRVEPDQVYFQIFEYGWSRTVALTMEY